MYYCDNFNSFMNIIWFHASMQNTYKKISSNYQLHKQSILLTLIIKTMLCLLSTSNTFAKRNHNISLINRLVYTLNELQLVLAAYCKDL